LLKECANLLNQPNLKKQLNQFKVEIEAIEKLIETQDSKELVKFIEISQAARNQWTLNG